MQPHTEDILAPKPLRRAEATPVPIVAGLALRDRASGFAGWLVRVEAGTVTIRDAAGRERVFPLTPAGFIVDGRPATLVKADHAESGPPARTASGSVPAANRGPVVARAGRIFVEGVHDAELIEKVWGDDLRELGLAVEHLDGIDDLDGAVRTFNPRSHRRLGVLVDHLVPGSKETRIVARVANPHVLVTGHPYVDVWEGVRPHCLGIRAWPTVPKGVPWKEGVCAALGVDDPRTMWRRVLGAVTSYADLETPLVGAVERLIDFVTDER